MVVVPAKQIKKNNLDAEINTLSLELEEKRASIATIIEREDRVKASEAALKDKKTQFEEDKHLHQAHLDRRMLLIVSKEKDYDNKLKDSQGLASKLEENVKQAQRELSKLNKSCINAAQELEDKGKQKDNLDSDIAELANLVIYLEDTRVKVAEIKVVKEKADEEIANLRFAWEHDLANLKSQKQEVEKQLLSKLEEVAKAEFMLKSYTDNLYTTMNDWQIIRTRLETRWKEHYPELDMPIVE